MQILVAQIGARRHYAVPVALHRAGMLDVLHTDWCVNQGLPRLLSRLSMPRSRLASRSRFESRRVPQIPGSRIRSHLGHTMRMRAARRRFSSNDEYWAQANARFGECVVRAGFGSATAIYGFNAAAVELFVAARNQGRGTILDQTMAAWGPVQQLLEEERARWPDWSRAASEGTSARLLADREHREWELADTIICGSQSVVDSLEQAGGPVSKCQVVPYGYDNQRQVESPPAGSTGPLKVLFVGTIDLRKGVPYLLEAAKQLQAKEIEFRMVGPVGISDVALRRLRERIEVVGPVSRSAVHEHYQWADVFVLPTLAEGSANVCYEAMSHGLPVLTTPGAGSVVRDGIDGWIVPPRSAEAIVERLRQACDDRATLLQLSANALERVSQFTWDRYMQALTSVLSTSLAPPESAALATSDKTE